MKYLKAFEGIEIKDMSPQNYLQKEDEDNIFQVFILSEYNDKYLFEKGNDFYNVGGHLYQTSNPAKELNRLISYEYKDEYESGLCLWTQVDRLRSETDGEEFKQDSEKFKEELEYRGYSVELDYAFGNNKLTAYFTIKGHKGLNEEFWPWKKKKERTYPTINGLKFQSVRDSKDIPHWKVTYEIENIENYTDNKDIISAFVSSTDKTGTPEDDYAISVTYPSKLIGHGKFERRKIIKKIYDHRNQLGWKAHGCEIMTNQILVGAEFDEGDMETNLQSIVSTLNVFFEAFDDVIKELKDIQEEKDKASKKKLEKGEFIKNSLDDIKTILYDVTDMDIVDMESTKYTLFDSKPSSSAPYSAFIRVDLKVRGVKSTIPTTKNRDKYAVLSLTQSFIQLVSALETPLERIENLHPDIEVYMKMWNEPGKVRIVIR